VLDVLGSYFDGSAEKDVFDLGCGTGGAAAALAENGYRVVGVDPFSDGIGKENVNYPELPLNVGSAYGDLSSENARSTPSSAWRWSSTSTTRRHSPRQCMISSSRGGIAGMSMPHHGYLKNLALAVMGKMDEHFMPLKDHGHIKVWSKHTQSTLLLDSGFDRVDFEFVGRIPVLAKSMFGVAQKPL